MRKTKVVVPWHDGLHARPATSLVKLARNFRSTILIKTRERAADAKSILSVLLLCAAMGTLLEVEVAGEDESTAALAIEQLFGQQYTGEAEEAVLPETDRVEDDKL